MELDIIGLLGACSYALDCVEAELTHVATKHGKRVAYMSVCTAQKMGITGDALQDLAACSLLHDNALTQYIHEEFHNDLTKNNTENITSKQLGIHCIYGEENLKMYPFLTDVKNVTGAQQGEEETDTVSKIETTQNSENEVVSDEKAGSSEISEESNSESAVQDTEASETQTTEKTQQTWGSIGGYYTVKRGDTLAGISKKMYQSYNYIEMIAEANGIDNVDEIYPGQILEIPQIED